MSRIGISVARTAHEQVLQGRQVSRANAQPGDLIFWADATGYVYHVAIYLGGGTMVSADNPDDGINVEAIWGAPVQFRTYR